MIGLLFIAAAIAAQHAPPTPTFRAGVTLVRVSVIAQDKQGKPVTDLRREEFTIFHNGSPQQIRLFLSESENSTPAPPELRAPNTFTNRNASSAGSHSGYSVILIDSIFADWGDIGHPGAANARLSALRALRSMPAGEKIAIYAVKRKLQVICEFTSDRELLERQLGEWKPGVDTPETSNGIMSGSTPDARQDVHRQVETGDAIKHATDAAIVQDGTRRVSSSNDGMDLVADHLADIPARKNLIWLSNRFVIGPQELRKFKDAGVSIYPVNIDGVTGALDPLNPLLKAIAAQTGGIAYDMRNDIDVAIREAMDDGRVSYTLGFYQSGDDDASPVHQIDVFVSRPGVKLRYYRAQAPRPASASAMTDLIQALNRPVDATAVPIDATVTRVQDRLNLKAVIDVGSLELASMQDRWKGRIEIIAHFTAADGSTVGDVVSQTLNLNVRRVQQGLGYRNDLKIPPKAVELRLLIANPASRKIGTLTIPLSEVTASEAK